VGIHLKSIKEVIIGPGILLIYRALFLQILKTFLVDLK